MIGYCQHCKKMIEIDEVTTVRLPNLNYVHRGLCSKAKCRNIIFVKIHDHEILIDKAGHKCPKEVFAGTTTPKPLINEQFGQIIITKNKRIETVPSDGYIKTVFDLKKELGDEKVNS